MPVLIYGLWCPVAGCFRYIGKTSDVRRRLRAHLRDAETPKTHKAYWIASIRRMGFEPELRIIRMMDDCDDWALAEQEEIAAAIARGDRLTNLTKGGEGAPLTEEARQAKIRAMSKAETRSAMKKAARERWDDPEKAKAGRAANATPEKRLKLAAAARARATPEYRALMAERTRAAWADRQKRQRIEAGITPEVRQKVSKASKRFWESNPNAEVSRKNLRLPTPEMLAAAADARRTPEHRAKMEAVWSDPGYRARLSDALKQSWKRRKGT